MGRVRRKINVLADDLNSDIFISKSGLRNKAKKHSLPYYLPLVWERWVLYQYLLKKY